MPRQLDENLWVFDRPLRVYGLHIGARMTAIQLVDGGLFLHSPIAPDPETRQQLDALGPVRFVVAPNKVHHLFVAGWREHRPDAQFWAAPGLPEKRRDLAFDHVLEDAPPPAWADEIDQTLVGGMPFLNEVVFHHRASRTLLVTDLAMNFTGSDSLLTRLWLRAMGIHGGFGCSRLLRRTVRDRARARASFERILSWDFERVIVSHGIVLQRSGRRLMREIYAWL